MAQNTLELTKIAEDIANDIAEKNSYSLRASSIVSNIEASYEVQNKVVETLIKSESRTKVAGYKIAMNAPAAMEQLGLSEPLISRIFDNQIKKNNAILSLSDFISLHYEPEIAFILNADFAPKNTPYTEQEVAKNIAYTAPVFEIIDTRNMDADKRSIIEGVAQNIHNAGIVMGKADTSKTNVDINFEQLVTRVQENDKTIFEQAAAAPQPPLEAVTFVINKALSIGAPVSNQMVIICGTHQPIKLIKNPVNITADMAEIGSVSMKIES